METFGDRLQRLRKAAGLSRQQFADEVGISRSAVTMIENGQTKSMAASNLLRAAEVLRVSPDELQHGDDPRSRTRFARVSNVARLVSVPIIGFAVATPEQDGYFDDMGFPPGAGEGYLPWPTKDPHAYALRVKGDSMQPRIRPGELIVAEPGSPVAPGADVVVRTRDGRKMVKQLLYRRGGEVALGSINQAHRQLTISIEDIESMHFITAIVPPAAVKE